MKLYEAITAVHEAMEGRYNLTGQDLYYIHGFLCELQPEENKKTDCPAWLTAEAITDIRNLWDSHISGGEDHLRIRAIKYLQEVAQKAGYQVDLKKAMELFREYC
jgi:hypothetical protein